MQVVRIVPLLVLSVLSFGACDVYVPGRVSGLPPGHGGVPPGHGGIPPGQAKKMGPPPVVMVGVPSFRVVPGTDVYVMFGVEADVFRIADIFYYHHEGSWYRSTHHSGPWSEIASGDLPPGLRGSSPANLKAKATGGGGGGGRGRGRGRSRSY